jgi:hypothetical protein
MGLVPAAALLALALAAPQPQPQPVPRVVEEIVAVVRNPRGAPARVVTLTKLEEEARVALVSRGATDAAWRPLDVEALRAALGWLLDQTLVADEAARLRLDELDREAIEAELRRFRARFATPAEFQRFLRVAELTQEELTVTLARSLRVQRYLESRVGRGARVDDAEVETYLRERGASLEATGAREAVRAHLAEEKVAADVKELVAGLRARAEIRILDPVFSEAAR